MKHKLIASFILFISFNAFSQDYKVTWSEEVKGDKLPQFAATNSKGEIITIGVKKLRKGIKKLKVKNNPRIHIPIFGNGDIDSAEKAYEYKNTYDVDGIMIGRAAIGYPWIFREIKHYFATGELMAPPTVEERVYAARTHLKHSITWKGNNLGILEMRRHYASYFKGLPDIKEFRARLTNSMIFEELDGILNEIQVKYAGFDFQKPLEMK